MSSYPYKYTAIIIEPRKHKSLELVLMNFVENLGKEWEFIFYHGTENLDFVMDIVTRNSITNIRFVALNTNNLSSLEYSKILYSREFYKQIFTSFFITFQTDTFISSKNKDKIYDFLEYDYVGAPWCNIFDCDGKHAVGNGGLSLRRTSKMVEMIDLYLDSFLNSNSPHIPFEDRFFSNTCGVHFEGLTLKKPAYTIAGDFSTETMLISENSFGVHKAWHWLSKPDLQRISENMPGLDQCVLMNM